MEGRPFPPGSYLVTKNEGLVILRGVHEGAVALTQARDGHGRIPPCLVFHKYGDEYSLAQVWTGEGRGGEIVQPSGELTSTRSRRSLASPPVRVTVPAL